MTTRPGPLVARLVVLTVIWVLGTSALTFATSGQTDGDEPDAVQAEARTGEETLLVPDVRRQPYVFAKGILEDAGFAWRVEGEVQGYAVNLVVSQSPAPGAHVRNTGAPTVVLALERNADYAERGVPENASSFEGTPVEILAEEPAPSEPPEDKPSENEGGRAPTPLGEPPSRAEDAAEPEVAVESAAEPEADAGAPLEDPEAESRVEGGTITLVPPGTPDTAEEPAPPQQTEAAAPEDREPAFIVPGAPPEPLDEIPLDERARRLERRLAGQPRTEELEAHWLYQHAWVVTGACFGWSHGAEALRILIRIDEGLQVRWGVGVRSEATAREALAAVLRLSSGSG